MVRSAPHGIVLKESFWNWPEKNIAGNAIDFFTHVEGKTFNQAMEIISVRHAAYCVYDPSERKIREEHGNTAKIAR